MRLERSVGARWRRPSHPMEKGSYFHIQQLGAIGILWYYLAWFKYCFSLFYQL